MPNNPPCYYCKAKPQRAVLARNLSTGTFIQQPPEDRHAGVLRDPSNRYSVTGLAAELLPPAFWIRDNQKWRYYHFEELTNLYPHRRFRGPEWEPTQPELDTILNHLGQGDATTCPESAACALGIHEGEEHPTTLVIYPACLTEQDRWTYAIPDVATLPLDMLPFRAAGHLIATVPNLLGACDCEDPQDQP